MSIFVPRQCRTIYILRHSQYSIRGQRVLMKYMVGLVTSELCFYINKQFKTDRGIIW